MRSIILGCAAIVLASTLAIFQTSAQDKDPEFDAAAYWAQLDNMPSDMRMALPARTELVREIERNKKIVLALAALPKPSLQKSAEKRRFKFLEQQLKSTIDFISARWTAEDLRPSNGKITVAFIDGDIDPIVFELIEEAAQDWSNAAPGISFNFRETSNGAFRRWKLTDNVSAALIRIDFDFRGGHTAVPGSRALNLGPNSRTMNLAQYDTELLKFASQEGQIAFHNSVERGTILHEFGHALAILHEHFHPTCQHDFKEDQVVQYYVDTYGWDRPFARTQLIPEDFLNQFSGRRDYSVFEEPDDMSVMLYAFPASVFVSGTQSRCLLQSAPRPASQLSDTDKRHAAMLYS